MSEPTVRLYQTHTRHKHPHFHLEIVGYGARHGP